MNTNLDRQIETDILIDRDRQTDTLCLSSLCLYWTFFSVYNWLT